jgi:hypothetical protein
MNCLWKVQTYCHLHVDTLDERQSLFSDMTMQEVYLFLSFCGGEGRMCVVCHHLNVGFTEGFVKQV